MRSMVLSILAVAAATGLVCAQRPFAQCELNPPVVKESVTSFICIVHAGEGDKPIFPIIISGESIPDAEISAASASINPLMARKMVVDSSMFGSLLAETNSRILPIAEHRKYECVYGTCEVIICESPDPHPRSLGKGVVSMRRILDRAQAVELLDSLIEMTNQKKVGEKDQDESIAAASKSLRDELEYFHHRIKPKEVRK